jgi:hypothetical protein
MQRTRSALVMTFSICDEISRAACFFLPAALPAAAALPAFEAIFNANKMWYAPFNLHFLFEFYHGQKILVAKE